MLTKIPHKMQNQTSPEPLVPMLGGEIAELALEGLQQVGPVAGLVGAPVGQLGGAVRAEVALHRLLVGLGRGEAGRGEILQCSC